MLKVIIADDEARVCRLIQMLVDWEALDMKVVGTAANGIEALELVEKLVPDILITDIRMPGCDGLDLIERVRQLNNQMEIIIISGYAQFEYAQIAIQKSVGGYLLKPIKKEALMTTLEKLGERVRERRASESAMEHLLIDGRKSQDLLKERLLEDLIHKRLDTPMEEGLCQECGFPGQSGLFQVFIVKIDYNRKALNESNLKVIRERVEEVLESEVFPYCETEIFRFYSSKGYGILHYETKNKGEIRRRLRECLNQLQVQKAFFGSVEFTFSMGKAIENSCFLPQSMEEAQNAISERLVEGTGRLLELVPAPSRFNTRQILEKYNRSIDHAVDSLSAEETEKAVDELAASIKDAKIVHGYELLELVLSAARLFVVRLNLEQGDDLMARFEEQCELCSKDVQLFEVLKDIQTQQITTLWEQQRNEAIRPVRMAKQYIQQHYMEPITLEEVCAAIGFSVSYFSTLFKKETGEGFLKYLTRVRMEQAKQLLQDTNDPISEICERVGYSDLKHFTSNFKKTTGLNPGQYRKLYG